MTEKEIDYMGKIKLLQHNHATFDYILDFARHNRKICIPQATGTGKTYLEARILECWNDRKAIIFAPSNEILRDTEKLLAEYDIHNFTTITYQTLNNMSEEEIINLNVDIILFDEAHRLLAEEWYKKVQILIESHPYSLIFGLTATPIRSDGRDIREEIFENCSTHYITLAEAIVRDIVKMPVYVSALYTFDEMVNDLEQKIDNGKNSDEEKIELKKKLNAAKKNLELSMGVPSIIKKYISDYNGKYIVFCRDTDHLEESVSLVNSWFRESGYEGNINNYKVGVNYNDSDERLEEFRNSDEVGLHLLFAIEKLNEGIHIPSVNGVILLRPTSSNIIYYQQIGRCITAKANKNPIVLDLVDNANGVKVVLKDDIEKCINIRMNGGYAEYSTDFDIEKYSIVDCLHETIDVFKEIENNIISKYEEWTKEEDEILIKYYASEKSKCAERLPNRSKNSCMYRAKALGLTKDHKKWTKEEDEILINYYISHGMEFCLENLPGRTRIMCHNRIKYLGLSSGKNKWTNEEIELLKNIYPKFGILKCVEMIPSHTKSAIKSMATKLKLKSAKIFSEKETIFIKENYDKYSISEIATILNRTESSIIRKINRVDLSRKTNKWSEYEKNIIEEKYPIMGTECIKFLSDKTKNDIYQYASKNGIKCNKGRYFYFDKTRNKWCVKIDINGKTKHFGRYNTKDEAGKVALEKARVYGKI